MMVLLCNCTKRAKQEVKKLDANTIGRKLVELRGDKTQDEVTKAVGISISALSMYEQGKRIPRDEIKIKLAQYYRTSIEEIFFAPQLHELCN